MWNLICGSVYGFWGGPGQRWQPWAQITLTSAQTRPRAEKLNLITVCLSLTRNMLPPKLKFENECTDFKHDQIWRVVYENIVQKLLDCQHNSWIVQHSSAPKPSEIVAVYFHSILKCRRPKMKWNLIRDWFWKALHRQVKHTGRGGKSAEKYTQVKVSFQKV